MLVSEVFLSCFPGAPIFEGKQKVIFFVTYPSLYSLSIYLGYYPMHNKHRGSFAAAAIVMSRYQFFLLPWKMPYMWTTCGN